MLICIRRPAKLLFPITNNFFYIKQTDATLIEEITEGTACFIICFHIYTYKAFETSLL